jgi:1-acyl-sn-glycerol-3-phosphate acyltransferase
MTAKTHPLAHVLTFIARVVSGVKAQQDGSAPSSDAVIYFANHTSHLDTVVLWSSLPTAIRARTRPVAAKDYWTSGRVRHYLATKVFRALLIDRDRSTATGDRCSGQHSVEQMLDVLRGGESLILFPEGTRGQGDDMAPFRSGLFHLASQLPEVDLVPVHLNNLNRILPKGELLLVPLLGSITFGAPFRMAAGESKAEFLTRARSALLDLKEASRDHRP